MAFIEMGRGGEIMMVMFFAQRVILDKTKFNEVPAMLQPGVHEILIDNELNNGARHTLNSELCLYLALNSHYMIHSFCESAFCLK